MLLMLCCCARCRDLCGVERLILVGGRQPCHVFPGPVGLFPRKAARSPFRRSSRKVWPVAGVSFEIQGFVRGESLLKCCVQGVLCRIQQYLPRCIAYARKSVFGARSSKPRLEHTSLTVLATGRSRDTSRDLHPRQLVITIYTLSLSSGPLKTMNFGGPRSVI